MSGRDVRRLAARATNMTHEAKRDIVARVAAGAVAMGVTDVFVTKEPFRIASMALEHMGLDAKVHVLDLPIRNSSRDTEQAVRAFLSAGCTTLLSIGGDGTNRIIVRALHAVGRCADVHLVALSTGTNNVFPVHVEPTVAGMVAGLQATRSIEDPALRRRTKVVHIRDLTSQTTDVGLVDAVLLKDDFVGNLLPFEAAKIERMLLTRAEPDAVGMSPIGGLVEVVDAADDAALVVEMDPQGCGFQAPLSPGAFQTVSVGSRTRIGLGTTVVFHGPGVLALDGDRLARVDTPGVALTVRRDGPWVLDIAAAMRWAVGQGIMIRS